MSKSPESLVTKSFAAVASGSDCLGLILIEGLSGRELEVLWLFAEGKSAEDAGQILHIALATVMFHYRKVADRYGTLNRTHTVVEAIRRGDLKLDQRTTSTRDDQVFLP